VKPDPLRERLQLSKIGNVRAVFHRSLPKDAVLKTCTVVREPFGEWYASLVCESVVLLQGIETPVSSTVASPRPILSPIGVDLGLNALVTTSDGTETLHPRFLRKMERRLKRMQRSFSRTQKGSKNRWKARKRVASLHAKVARQRADFNHKLSYGLVAKHDLIGFEDLRIKNMVRNHGLAKSISDAGWGQLVRFVEYKALDKGKLVVKVEPAYSTCECFFCGTRNKVSLRMREWVCAGCGRTLRRDHNGAMIVLKRALAQVGQGMPELKPVETEPLLVQTTGRASPIAEKGTSGLVNQGEDVTKTE